MKIRDHLNGPEDGHPLPVRLTVIVVIVVAATGVVVDRREGIVVGVLAAAAVGLLITVPWALLTARRDET